LSNQKTTEVIEKQDISGIFGRSSWLYSSSIDWGAVTFGGYRSHELLRLLGTARFNQQLKLGLAIGGRTEGAPVMDVENVRLLAAAATKGKAVVNGFWRPGVSEDDLRHEDPDNMRTEDLVVKLWDHLNDLIDNGSEVDAIKFLQDAGSAAWHRLILPLHTEMP
jgi:hypothetical protein